jgi:hypothetical protein
MIACKGIPAEDLLDGLVDVAGRIYGGNIENAMSTKRMI